MNKKQIRLYELQEEDLITGERGGERKVGEDCIELKRLLDDCYDTFKWITECEYWDYIKENSSAEDMMYEIDSFINNNAGRLCYLEKTKIK